MSVQQIRRSSSSFLSSSSNFVVNSVQLMFSDEEPVHNGIKRTPEWTNLIVGLSCLFYWLPAIAGYAMLDKTRGPSYIYECIMYVLVGIASFSSDYIAYEII